MRKRGTQSWGESRRPTRSASSFSASPSANPVSTRKRTATPACPSPTPVRGGTTCSTCANRSSASAKRRPVAACVSTRALRPRGGRAPCPGPEARRRLDAIHELTRCRARAVPRRARAEDAPRARRFERAAPEPETRREPALRALAPRPMTCRALAASSAPRPGAGAVLARAEHGAARRRPRRRSARRATRAAGRSRSPGAPWARRRCRGSCRSTAAGRRAGRLERVGARPDRLALWAVVLGFFLIFVAVTSTSHAATRAHSAGAAAGRLVHQQVVRTHTATLRATPPAR